MEFFSRIIAVLCDNWTSVTNLECNTALSIMCKFIIAEYIYASSTRIQKLNFLHVLNAPLIPVLPTAYDVVSLLKLMGYEVGLPDDAGGGDGVGRSDILEEEWRVATISWLSGIM